MLCHEKISSGPNRYRLRCPVDCYDSLHELPNGVSGLPASLLAAILVVLEERRSETERYSVEECIQEVRVPSVFSHEGEDAKACDRHYEVDRKAECEHLHVVHDH